MSRYNTIRTVKCEHCNKVGKIEKNVSEINQRFGNPFYICKNCGEVNYDDGIIEPALLPPERLRKYAQTQSGPGRWILIWFGTLLAVLTVSFMMDSFVLSLLALIPAALVLIWILIKEEKTLDESAYDKQVRNSMIRMLADENYAKAMLEEIKPAPNSAWETQRETFELGEISEEEIKALYYDIDDGCPNKTSQTWLLIPAFGIGMLIMFIVALVSGKVAFVKEPEPLVVVDLREADVSGQAVTYETDSLFGPFAEHNLSGDGYYLSVDEEGKYHVVFLPKNCLAEYQALIDGTASNDGKTSIISGYTERLPQDVKQYAEEGIVEIVNFYFGSEIMTEEMLPEDILNQWYLSVEELKEPSSWALSGAGLSCLIIGIIELLIGFVFYDSRK